jgi:uncharacterized protein (DUF342 family)
MTQPSESPRRKVSQPSDSPRKMEKQGSIKDMIKERREELKQEGKIQTEPQIEIHVSDATKKHLEQRRTK